MENPKLQLIERLKTANNVLVTVSSNPSVDQLSSAIGLTLMLNKMGKHATAVFSGKVPSTIEFLQPEKTIEKNTDSLRDFIIALDKTKADKLRYKVEDSHVKIFITPYRTSISDKDLEFSQGDFNVEVVIALGVNDPQDLDKAITAHGRILHDATTISITNGTASTLGSINWDQSDMSSLCEMVASFESDLQPGLFDAQVATALMTGIVAQTERFRNAKTSPATMTIASALMAAGANQQLIATQLEEEIEVSVSDSSVSDVEPTKEDEKVEDQAEVDAGALKIEHEELAEEDNPETPEEISNVVIDESGNIVPNSEPDTEQDDNEPVSAVVGGGTLILDPPTIGGTLTANSQPEKLDPATDPLSANDTNSPLLQHQSVVDVQTPDQPQEPSSDLPSDLPPPVVNDAPTMPADLGISPVEQPQVDTKDSGHDQTLTELEAVVQKSYEPPKLDIPAPELSQEVAATETEQQVTDLGDARDAVSDALASINEPLQPIQSLNAQPFDINAQLGQIAPELVPQNQPVEQSFTMPENLVPTQPAAVDPTATQVQDPTAPPTVPPPFMPNMPGLDPSLMPPPTDPQPPTNLPAA